MDNKRIEKLITTAEELASGLPAASDTEAIATAMHTVRGIVEALSDGTAVEGSIRDALDPPDIGRMGTALGWLRSNAVSAFSSDVAFKRQVAERLNTIAVLLGSIGSRSTGHATVRKVFISYSTKDVALGQSLHDALTAAGLDPFLSAASRGGLPGGHGYFENLVRAMREAHALVVLATPPCVEQQWASFEAGGVYGAGKPTLPVMIGIGPKQLPDPLQHIQGVECSDGTKVKAMLAGLVEMEPGTLWAGEALVGIDAFLSMAITASRKYGPRDPAAEAVARLVDAVSSNERVWDEEKLYDEQKAMAALQPVRVACRAILALHGAGLSTATFAKVIECVEQLDDIEEQPRKLSLEDFAGRGDYVFFALRQALEKAGRKVP